MLTEFVPKVVTDNVVAEEVSAILLCGTFTVKLLPEVVTDAAPVPVPVTDAATELTVKLG